ncbi:MAG: hypothetical protein AB7G75_15030 [Candidatus Binatia bacterium]
MTRHNGVRTVRESDLSALVALHETIYPAGASGDLATRTAYLKRLLFQHPWQADGAPSLVYENATGDLVGLIGVVPRPMEWKGQPLRMTTTHNYMVDPSHRSSLAGISLLKTYLAGSQDLSLCQAASGLPQKLWRSFGGTIDNLHSFHWLWPLRSVTYISDRLAGHGIPPLVVRALKAGGRVLDAFIDRVRARAFGGVQAHVDYKDLSVEHWLDGIIENSRGRALRPVYDVMTLQWLLQILEGKRRFGTLRKHAIYKTNGEHLGYYIYYATTNDISYVLQVGARTGAEGSVLDALARDAWEQGALALSGWLDTRFIPDISERALYWKYQHDGPVLIYTRDSELEAAMCRGDAWLTPLEAEWWMWNHGWVAPVESV